MNTRIKELIDYNLAYRIALLDLYFRLSEQYKKVYNTWSKERLSLLQGDIKECARELNKLNNSL